MLTRPLLTLSLIFLTLPVLWAQPNLLSAELWSEKVTLSADPAQFYVAAEGKSDNSGSQNEPWDLASVLLSKQEVPPGSVVWVRGGRYALPDAVTLSGAEGKPIHLRAYPGERVSIDGGLVGIRSDFLWIWDLEMSSAKLDWRPAKAIGKTASIKKMPGARGPMEVSGGRGCKFINLIIHNNSMGLGYWKQVAESELHACLIYNNGYPGTDRPHGPGIYTQNMSGTTRHITDNLVAGNFSTGMQMYGSRMDEMVNDYRVEGNVWFAPRSEAGGRNYVLCGGGKSRNIVFRNNVSYGYDVRLGTEAGQLSQGNTVMHAGLGGPEGEGNRVLEEPEGVEVIIRPNHYDPRRAHLIVINGPKTERVEVDLSAFVKQGETLSVRSALDYHGPALFEGVYEGTAIELPLPEIPWELHRGSAKELGVYVILKGE
ncbi:MAG: right-handed parallel beta-helix repeat-containing protein [Verrucomicrobiales bacterium]